MKTTLSSRIRFCAGLMITAACIWLAVRHIRVDEVTRAAQSVRPSCLVLAMVALVAGYTARIYRWGWMLRAYNPAVRPRSCAWPLLVGFAVNNVAPFRAGDALRVVGFRRTLDTPAVQVFGSLLIERTLDLTILLAFFLVGTLGANNTEVPVAYLHTAVLTVSLAVLAWVILLWIGDHFEALLVRVCRSRVWSGSSLGTRVEHHIRQLFVALNLVRAPGAALKLLALSVVVWSCEGGIFAAVATGLHYGGRPFGPWFALATGSLATMIPSSPGYIGTFDFFTISGFTLYGTNETTATAMALVIHIVLWLPITAAGLMYLLFTHVWRRTGQYASKPLRRQ